MSDRCETFLTIPRVYGTFSWRSQKFACGFLHVWLWSPLMISIFPFSLCIDRFALQMLIGLFLQTHLMCDVPTYFLVNSKPLNNSLCLFLRDFIFKKQVSVSHSLNSRKGRRKMLVKPFRKRFKNSLIKRNTNLSVKISLFWNFNCQINWKTN